MIEIGTDKNTLYTWNNYGDVEVVPFRELQAWRKREIIKDPKVIILDEDLWQTNNSYFGTCGKFVLDTTNRTVRLPNSVGILEGTNSSSELGYITPAGLPNITGSSTLYAGSDTSNRGVVYDATNAFYNDGSNSGIHYASTGSTKTVTNSNFNIDASRSSAIYGRSNTVQPQTTKVLHYMVVSK